MSWDSKPCDAIDVVLRIWALSNYDAVRATSALNTLGDSGKTAVQLLLEGQVARAYLVAMRVLHPPHPAEMMVGEHPLDVRHCSVAVLDED